MEAQTLFLVYWAPSSSMREGEVPLHQQAILETPAPFWHCLPRDSIGFYRFYKTATHTPPPPTPTTPFKMPLTIPGCYLCFWLTGYKSKVTVIPLLTSPSRLINLPERFTELRKSTYSLDYCFIMKGHNSEQPNGRDAYGKMCGKEHGASMLSSGILFSPNLYMFSNPEALWTLNPVFLWRPHYPEMMN